MSIFFVAAIWPSRRTSRIAALSVCAILFVAATIYAGTAYFQVCYPEDTVPAVVSAHRAGAGFEGMYEYEPPNADISQIAAGFPDSCLVVDPSIAFGKPNLDDPDENPIWDPAKDSCLAVLPTVGGLRANPEHRRITGTVPQSGYLVLRLLRYPSWTIRLNGRLLTALPQRDDGLIATPISLGPVDLTLDWTVTRDNVVGSWLSVMSILLFVALSLFEHRLGRSRLT